MKTEIKAAYLAPEGFESQLIGELEGVCAVHGRLVLTDCPPVQPMWAQNIWLNPERISVTSITDAVKKIKSIQRNWWHYSYHLHRRAALIQEKLPYFSARPIKFPSVGPKSALGSWTLLDAGTVLAASHCSSLFPNGEIRFEENKEEPPSRAYLKLWEALTLIQKFPGPGQFCLDLGGSPGGWTWVAQNMGARVLSVDRSPLDPRISALPRVEFQKRNAFSIKPEEIKSKFQSVDWLFCDVVCYPEKLYDWILNWVESDVCRNFICTVKFQGENCYAGVRELSAIPGSRIMHLFHNKHELTWFLVR